MLSVRRGLYFHLIATVSLVIVGIIAAHSWLTSVRQERLYEAALRRGAVAMVRNLAEACAHYLVVGDYAGIESLALRTVALPNLTRVEVCEPDGQLLADVSKNEETGAGSSRLDSPPLQPPATARHTVVREGWRLVVWEPVTAGSDLGWLRVTYSLEELVEIRRSIWTNAWTTSALWIALGVGAVSLVILRPVRAVRELSEFARDLDLRKGETTPVPPGPEEITLLASSLNQASRALYATEQQLVGEREKLSVTLGSIGDGVIATDTEGRVVYLNRVAEDLTGWTTAEAAGLPLEEVFAVANADGTEITRDLFATALGARGRQELPNAARLRSRNNTDRQVADSCAPIVDGKGRLRGVVVVFRDVTERAKLEAHLAQAQKLEAIGTLAGGIAHDFNNILVAILGFTEMALLDVPADSPARGKLERVVEASDRAADLVRQILAFSRKHGQADHPVQPGSIAKEALKLLRATIPTTIDIRQTISARRHVAADPTHLHQIIMNLCTNAALAMADGGGVLEVTLEDVDVDADFAARHPGLAPGPFVCLSVADTGCGMAPDVLPRIFEPFFTTRPEGAGTGLGLSVVHGIAQSQGGTITVDSTPGRGSTFRVYLPSVDPAQALADAPQAPPPTGTERVLFVDDEPMLVELGKEMLGRLGYRVTAFTDSQDALSAFRADPDAYDVVLTDTTMPGMPGDLLAKALKETRPDLPVILCTGYSSRLGERPEGIDALAFKPLALAKLARLVRTVLDRRVEGVAQPNVPLASSPAPPSRVL